MRWWIAVFAVLAVLAVLLFKRMPVEVIYAASATHKRHAFRLKIYGIDLIRDKKTPKKRRKIAKNKPKNEENEQKNEKKFGFSEFTDLLNRVKKVYNHIKEGLREVLAYLGRKTQCSGFTVHLDLGFENAAHTGIAAGAAYGTVYGFASMVYNSLSMDKDALDIEVNPRFDRPCADLYIKGIFRISPAHIIKVFFMLLSIFKKVKNIMKD